MSNFLQLFQFFPYVLGAVQAVEQAAVGMPGVTKKQIVLGSILGAAKVGEQVPLPQVALISALIDSVVTALNGAGFFHHNHGPAAPAPPPPPPSLPQSAPTFVPPPPTLAGSVPAPV